MVEIFPPGTMDFFDRICVLTGGRASGANLTISSPGALEDPEQATVVRQGSAHTAGNDVMVGTKLWGWGDSVNYHVQGLPPELADILAPVDGVPAAGAMLIMHELGHVTMHPAGDSDKYNRQGLSIPIPISLRWSVMNVLSDLVLNHNVMHASNLRGTDDPDIIREIRTKALYGLASLYMAPACENLSEHARLRDAGSLPDTRYRPTEPCTARSDPDADGNQIPCSVAAAGGIHDVGCFDEHFVDAADASNVGNFSVPGPGTPPYQTERGHGRGPQIYPMLPTAVVNNLAERFRRVRVGRSKPSSPYHDGIPVHNCKDCGNIWYPRDPVYSDVAMAGFDNPQPQFADGSVCPGRIPWESTCGSTNTVTYEIPANTEFTVLETLTWDNRTSADTAIGGMEPVWAVGIDPSSPGIVTLRGTPGPLCYVNLAYLDHLCPDCGEPTGNLYGGVFSAWRRLGPSIGRRIESLVRSQDASADKAIGESIYFQQLQMQQWAAIYATMSDLEPDLRITNASGGRVNRGIASARRWIKLFGIDAARDNRGF